MKKRILYCYSQEEFDQLMGKLGWKNHIDPGYSTVSICAPWNEGFEHWFSNSTDGNFNLDCDDVVTPFWWNRVNHYDEALELYLHGQSIESAEFFNYQEPDHRGLRMFNYDQAFKLARWIDQRIRSGNDNFYIHCAAGWSRSQAVVKYIIDVYPDIAWQTRTENPCLHPNNHIVLMLKRAARQLNIL